MYVLKNRNKIQKTLTTTFVSLFSEHINGFSSEIQQSNGSVYLE